MDCNIKTSHTPFKNTSPENETYEAGGEHWEWSITSGNDSGSFSADNISRIVTKM